MNKKTKIILSIIFIISLSIAFVAGFFVGKHFLKTKSKKAKYISFYQTKKNFGKPMSDDEKKSMKLFIVPYEECFRKQLNKEEQEKVLNIQKEVLDLAKDNIKVKFKINDLKTAKNEKLLIKKMRKCQKNAYKMMSKNDRKTFRTALSKLELESIISIFHGIR